MAEIDKDPAISDAIGKLKVQAILTYKTDPMEDDEVEWATPRELRDACLELREAVQSGAPDASYS